MEESRSLQLHRNDTQLVHLPSFPVNTGNRNTQMVREVLLTLGDQKKFPIIDLPPGTLVTQDQIEYFKRFGIYLDESLVIDREARWYVLFVDVDHLDNLEEYCERFCSMYFPEGVEPTFYDLNKVLTSTEEIKFFEEKLREIYPNIQPLTPYGDVVETELTMKLYKDRTNAITSLSLVPYYLDEDFDAINKEFTSSNQETLNMLYDLEKKIVEEYRASGQSLAMTANYVENSLVIAFAAYMFAKYQIRSHFSGIADTRYRKALTDIYWDMQFMTLSDKINLLKNLPVLAISRSSHLDINYAVIINEADSSLAARITYIDYEDENDNLESTSAHIKSLNLIPWESEYNLNSKGSIFEQEHSKVMEILTRMGNARGTGKLPDVTNTCLAEINGRKVILMVDGFDVRVNSVFIPISSKLPSFHRELGITELSHLMPINAALDFKQALASVVKAMQSEIKDMRRAIKFYRQSHFEGYLIHVVSKRSPRIPYTKIDNWFRLGLWWDFAFRHRYVLNDSLSRFFDLNKSRNYENYFSIFGGPVPFLTEELRVNEEFVKG